MNHHTLINILRTAADKALFFEYRAGDGSVRVGAGYHVTEVRAAHVRAVDCGGREDAWAEVIVQLWVPEGGGRGLHERREIFEHPRARRDRCPFKHRRGARGVRDGGRARRLVSR